VGDEIFDEAGAGIYLGGAGWADTFGAVVFTTPSRRRFLDHTLGRRATAGGVTRNRGRETAGGDFALNSAKNNSETPLSETD
jgi:hypothetical protein